MFKLLFTFSLFAVASGVSALAPIPDLKVKNTLGEVVTWELKGKDIEINGMPSEFNYNDLTEKEMKNFNTLMKTKQEYGKMFGFDNWQSTGQKLVEKNGERIILVEGTYKDAQKKTVNFIEVYWANKTKSGQYLITSNSVPLKMNNFSDYLK